MEKQIIEALKSKAKTINNPANKPVNTITDASLLSIAQNFKQAPGEIYLAALKNNICPERYLRNQQIISFEDQIKLAQTKLGIIGAGGLGGQSIILLSRLGIGYLRIVDYDVFDESNLNRQALSSMKTIGKYKVDVAQETVQTINPAVIVDSIKEKMVKENIAKLLNGLDIVIDALDNAKDRILLEAAASKANVTMIHGALAGFDGQFSVIKPDQPCLSNLFDTDSLDNQQPGAEKILGVPAVTASLIASLQTMEVLKLLLHRGESTSGVLTHISLEGPRINKFKL